MYSLPSHKARICRIAGAVFLFLSAFNAVGFTLWLIAPAPHVYCDVDSCRMRSEPLTLLDEEDRAIVASSPANERRFANYVTRSSVRLGLAGVRLFQLLPFTVLVFGVGLALWRLGGRGGDPLGRALGWFRYASIAAILWAVSKPIANTLTSTILLPGISDDEYYFYFAADWGEFATAFMLAVATYATVWGLEAGVKAQRDLAEIV